MKGETKMADEAKTTKKRAPQKARPQFLLMQVLDEAGNPMKLDKSQINIVACTRNSAEALDKLDGGEFENVVYKKVEAD